MARHKKRHVRIGRLATILALLILMIGTLVYAVYRLSGGGSSRVAEVWQETTFSTGDTLIPFEDGVLLNKAGNLSFLGMDGISRWSATINSNRLAFVVSGQNIAVFSPKLLDVLDDKGAVALNYQLDAGNIESLQMGSKYIALKVVNNSAVSIKVIDFTGKAIDEQAFLEQTVVSYGLTDQNLLWVLTLDATTGAPVSRLAIYQPGQSMKCAYSIPDQLAYAAAFTGDKIFVVCNNYCVWYNYVGDKLDETLIYGWKLAAASGTDTISMALLPDSVNKDNAAVPYARLLKNGQLSQTLRMPEKVLSVALNAKYFIVLQPGQVTLNPLSGKRSRTIALPSDVTNGSVVNNGKGLLLNDGKKVYYLPVS